METRESCFFHALYQVAVTINSSLEPKDVLKAIVHSTAGALRAKGCSIMLLSPDRRELRHGVDFGLSDRYIRKGPVSVDLSMAEALQGHSVAVLDAGHDPRVQYAAENLQEGIASILSAPIRLRGEVIGVMRVYTSEPTDFTTAEIEFVEAVANLGAIALENARRHDEVQYNYDMVSRYIYNDIWIDQMWGADKSR
jgi:GAF domain-containing protein